MVNMPKNASKALMDFGVDADTIESIDNLYFESASIKDLLELFVKAKNDSDKDEILLELLEMVDFENF